MGTEDEMQKGKRLFNEGKFAEAMAQFEKTAEKDPASFEAKKYAGIAALRLQLYDKAINYFTMLEKQNGIYSNPGLFYHALTLLKRNQPGDKQQAKQLLQEVVEKNLEGKEAAQDWLKRW